MKNLLLTYIFVLLAISTTNAQFFNQADVEIYKNDIAKQAKSLVKEHLDLTADQAEIFWPLYDKYEAKYSVVLNEELKVLEDYLMNYYMLSDEKAEELMNKSINAQTITRQNLITTRLLEAEKAEIEREYEDKRESESAEDFYSNPVQFFEYKEKENYSIEYLNKNSHKLNNFYNQKYKQYLNNIKTE
jgi:hypothetical protein